MRWCDGAVRVLGGGRGREGLPRSTRSTQARSPLPTGDTEAREGGSRTWRSWSPPDVPPSPPNHGDRAAASPPRLHLVQAPGPPGLFQQLPYWHPSHSWPATNPVNGIVDVPSRVKVMRVIQGTLLEVRLKVKLVTEGASRLFCFGLV